MHRRAGKDKDDGILKTILFSKKGKVRGLFAGVELESSIEDTLTEVDIND